MKRNKTTVIMVWPVAVAGIVVGAALIKLTQSVDELSDKFDNLAGKIDYLSDKIDYLYKKAHDAENSLDLAKDCSVRLVQVYYPSVPHRQQNDTKQALSAGTLVSIEEKKYVLTNRHVIVDPNHNHSCYRDVQSVFRRGHVAVKTVQVEEALVSTVDDIDLALIPVQVLHSEAQEDYGRYCTVVKNKRALALSDKLVAFLPAEDDEPSEERVFTAQIHIMDHTRPLIGGTFGGKTNGGHSGLGYFANGLVVVVHREFAHVAAGDPLVETVDASKAHDSSIFKPVHELEYQRCAK